MAEGKDGAGAEGELGAFGVVEVIVVVSVLRYVGVLDCGVSALGKLRRLLHLLPDQRRLLELQGLHEMRRVHGRRY